MQLYHHPLSPCAQKVRLVLAEKGLDFEPVMMNLAEKQNLEPEYLALNPKGVVPTLVEDGVAVIESTLINEYLEDRYPETPLRPADPAARAEMRLWPKLVDDKVHPANGGIAWAMLVLPAWEGKTREEKQALIDQVLDPVRRARQERFVEHGLEASDFADGLAAFGETIAYVDKKLADGPYLMGDSYTLADAALVPYAHTLLQFGFEAMYESRHPNFTAWFQRCRERSSYKVAITDWLPAERWAAIKAMGAEAWPIVQRHTGL
jgi:glutathione S-transferase